MSLIAARTLVLNVAPPSVDVEYATTSPPREYASYVTWIVPVASTRTTEPWL